MDRLLEGLGAATIAAVIAISPCRRAAGNQARPDHALQRHGIGIGHHRSRSQRLLRHAEREGRHQRPQGEARLPRRRLLAAEDCRADPQARRAGACVAIFGSLGTGGLVATKDYLIGRGVPQLFLSIGNNIWGPEADKIGTLFAPLRHTETDVYARYIAAKRPNAKIGILSQNDDFGRELVKAMSFH